MKYKKEIRDDVVKDIVEGKLLLSEAMLKYGVLSPITIKKWLMEAKGKKDIILPRTS